MCGIVGIINLEQKNIDNFDLQASLEALNKRGPDNQGIYHHKHILLGHTRLAIIDTDAKANQPFIDSSGNYVLIYNGEIFNYKELKLHLLNKGYNFKTHSDTEVLLYLLIEEGKNALQKLNGFFSFAFYNKAENYLLLARDRFGEKPLVYFLDKKIFFFASELKAILPFLKNKQISSDALHLYFELSYIPAPLTIFENVYKLYPGHYIEIKNQNFSTASYYNRNVEQQDISYAQAQKMLKELMYDAVKLRMITDVPMGGFLSGGVDSTITCGIAHDIDKSFESYTIGFKKQTFFDESNDAKKAAAYLGIKHHIVWAELNDYYTIVNQICEYLDEPFADSSCIPFYLLCSKTKSHITVALTGDGADELFSGYNKHKALLRSISNNTLNLVLKKSGLLLSGLTDKRNNKISNKIRQVKKYAAGLNKNFAERYYDWACFTNTDKVNKLLKLKPASEKNELIQTYTQYIKADDFNTVLLADQKLVLANDMLFKADMMSMANSMEVRPVFLDYRITELVNSFPSKYKINTRTSKKILRDTFTEFFEPDLITKPKKGFEAPLHYLLTQVLKKELLSLLKDEIILKQNIFNIESISRIKHNLLKDKIENESTLWAIYVFQKWYIQNINYA
jgi:asparagine synthase (glutamine-hydrolysing)